MKIVKPKDTFLSSLSLHPGREEGLEAGPDHQADPVGDPVSPQRPQHSGSRPEGGHYLLH